MEAQHFEASNARLQNPPAQCAHCGLPVRTSGARYCCRGCETVAELLRGKGLDHVGADRKLTALETPAKQLELYSTSRFREEFVRDSQVRFLLEGVHCLSCVWILERLPQLQPHIQESRLSFAESVLSIRFSNLDAIPNTVKLLFQLGYRPTPIHPSQTESTTAKLADQRLMKQVGVAAVSAGNIMLLAIPRYAGLEGNLGRFFDLLMGALFLPVLLYSSRPFFEGAWSRTRRGLISIDTPLALVIAVAGVLSYWGLFSEQGELYFDSLAVLVFLLLASRAFLKHLQKRHANTQTLFSFLAPLSATIRTPSNTTQTILIQDIREGDVIVVDEGERIPCDGLCVSGDGMIQNALLTGEPIPVHCEAGTGVFAGTQLVAGSIVIRANAPLRDSRLGKLIEAARTDAVQKSNWVTQADRIARYFVVGIIVLSILAAITIGLNAALALLIVGCPCALGLATPLTAIRALSIAARRGIFIQDANALEALQKVGTVVFDKTGTLTLGAPQLVQVVQSAPSTPLDAIKPVVQTLERGSEHPVGRMLFAWSAPAKSIPSVNVIIERNAWGEKRSAHINGSLWTLERKPTHDESHWTHLLKDGLEICAFQMEDPIRPEARDALLQIRERGLKTALLTGDSEARAQLYGRDLGFSPADIHAHQTPEAKARWIQKNNPVLYLGDGANDALALRSASVGVATSGAMEMALRSADIYIKEDSLRRALELLTLSRSVKRTLRTTLTFSTLYNIFGVSLVFMNWITPLTAAIIMPISAVTVFGLSMTLTGRRAR